MGGFILKICKFFYRKTRFFASLIIPMPAPASQTYLPITALTSWWAQPFNGQLLRFQSCVEICQKFKPQIAIETGTFYGTTTVALSSLVSDQTFTIEINQEYANLAKVYFSAIGLKEDRVIIIKGDSSTELNNILLQINNQSRILVYLDAHWGMKLPLQDELTSLINWGGAFVAIIDDFYVDHDQDFGFDTYGGTKLDLELIPKNFSGHIFLPNHSAKQEYGARRGTCFLISSQAALFMADLNLTHLKSIQI